MNKPARALVLLMTVFIANSAAGIRGPGKYHGVVVFDRWDTCYIYSGVFLMYVSQRAKKKLREYEGHAMFIDALKVDQPINPGDGRIDRLRVIGPARSRRPGIQPDGLVLKLSPESRSGSPRFIFEIQNRGKRRVEIQSGELALTLLGKKGERVSVFDPSDGDSTALITRTSLGNRTWSGRCNDSHYACFWSIGDKPLPNHFRLKPGETRFITISLRVPRGEYDFLCGYGGGVHEDKSLASNLVGFDVDQNGIATVVNVSRQ